MNAKIPILVLAYNRPELVAQVMCVLQEYRPSRVYLACDGARTQRQGDAEKVEETRETMLRAVNWECEVHTLFREHNLGCAQGVYDAISWFFNREEYGVILEDDVLVSQDYFRLCEELLPRYKNEPQIMQVVSRNTSRRTDIPNTYVFSQTDSCWGWASWRRAWQKMDMQMEGINRISVLYLIKRLGLFRGGLKYYQFKDMYSNIKKSNSWATRWALSILCNDGLVICPGVNLGVNIGMESGEHYDKRDAMSPAFRYELQSLIWPIKYNDSMRVDKKQKWYDISYYYKERLFGLIHKRLKSALKIKKNTLKSRRYQ